jgi:hypothetical protein
MKLPFTTVQFFNIIENYNSTVFPLQLILILLGIVCLFIFHSGLSTKNKLIGTYLGILWIWIGLVYHLLFFTAINKAAFLFGGLFILQGLFILYSTLGKNRLIFVFTLQTKDFLGYFFILYGLIIYPLISYFVEGSIGRTIVMGLPCPSTIFTFGFFILAGNKFPKYLLIIPFLWAIVGLSAAINIGVFQDVMIIIAAISAVVILSRRKEK